MRPSALTEGHKHITRGRKMLGAPRAAAGMHQPSDASWCAPWRYSDHISADAADAASGVSSSLATIAPGARCRANGESCPERMISSAHSCGISA